MNKLKQWYSAALLWWESFGSDGKPDAFTAPAPVDLRVKKNDKLTRGVRHLVSYLRKLGPEGREQLVREDANVLMRAGRSSAKTTVEKFEEAKAASRLVSGPRAESVDSMANTFVKNQHKYRLQARIRGLHKEMRNLTRPAEEVRKDLEEARRELRKYE